MELKKVNCIVFSFGYAEECQVSSFIFSTDFFGVKDYSPIEALVSLSNDWYHWYLNEMSKDVWSNCKKCCRESHNKNIEYCDVCNLNLQIEPSEENFKEFLLLKNNGTIFDGFWSENMSGYTPSWDPFWKHKGINHIIKGDFLAILHSAEDFFTKSLVYSGKYPEVFNLEEASSQEKLNNLLEEIQNLE